MKLITRANLPAERAPRWNGSASILSMVDIATGEASDSEPTCAHLPNLCRPPG